ncbi:MAG: MipA/OmpV family protein [Burkholderiaceae bacterium]|nr:MipA/OmpV family protein [Burkholderiaceae bacterium]
MPPFAHHLPVAALLTALTSQPVMAQPAPATPPGESTVSVGLMTTSEWRPYRGVGNTTSLFPLLQYENAWLDIWGPGADIKLKDDGPLAVMLRARYADTGYDASDSEALAGMKDRKNSVWLGTKLQWRTAVAHTSLEWLTDGSRHSKGQQAKLWVETMMHAGPVRIVPRAGLQWQDAKYVDYHFGVTAAEATATRPAYRGHSVLNTELGARFLYTFTPSQSGFVDLSATALGSAIRRSPIVERSWVPAVRAGYVYRF